MNKKIFGCLLGWYTIYTFWWLFPLTEFCHVQNIHFASKSRVLLHWQRHCTALQLRALAKLLRRGTRNGITELSQTAPPIFGWAAITLGIRPHSSSDLVYRFTVGVIEYHKTVHSRIFY